MVLGASALDLGVIEGFAEGLASLLKLYSGWLADRFDRRRPLIAAGYFLAAIAKPLIGASTGWPQVLGARCLDRFGKGLRTAPRDALIANSVASEDRGAAFGFHRAMDTAGAFVGPLLALIFLTRFQNHSDLRWLYYFALIPGLMAVALVYLVADRKTRPGNSPFPKISWIALPQEFRKYLVAWGLFSLTNSSDAFLILRAQSCGLSFTQTVLLYALYNLIFASASPRLGSLSDKLGRRPILIFGLLTFAIVYLGFAVAAEPWHFVILFTIYGLYNAATDGVGKAYAVDLIPGNLKATGLGTLGFVTGFSTIFASAVGGFLWDRHGPWSLFLFGAVGALLAAGLLAVWPTGQISLKEKHE